MTSRTSRFTEKDPFIVTRNNLVDEYAMCER